MAATLGDKSPLHTLLQTANLLGYEAALLEKGADDLGQLKDLSETEFRDLCAMVGMETKPFHMMRFRKALGRQYSLSTLSPTPTAPNQIQHVPARKLTTSLSANPLGVNPPFQILHHQQSAPCVFAQPLTTLQNTHNRRVQVFTPTTNQLANFHLTHSIPPTRTRTSQHQHNPVTVTLQLQPPGSSTSCVAQGSSSSPLSALTESTTSPQKIKPGKRFFLPPYLQPGSDCTAFDDLVDDSTPVQKGLGPCPISPNMWDSQRAELIKKHSAIYGQNVNKRKMEKLSLHEENVNEAAQQLCMRDPTLLVRREELFILARRAVKEGGYAFHRGYSRSKDADNSSLPAAKLFKIDSSDDEGEEDGDPNLQPIKRRDQRVQRLSELEDLIAKNKSEQAVKLDALIKAQQASEFANAYHIQLEIESLGNACHKLQTEYSVLKRKQRRSERYFKSKDRPKETPPPARKKPPLTSPASSNLQMALDTSQPQTSNQLLIHSSLPQATETITENGNPFTGIPEGIAITTTAVQAISEKALEFEREKAPIFPTRHNQPTPPNLLPYLTETTPPVTATVAYSQEGNIQRNHSGNHLYASGVSSPQLHAANQFHGVPPGLITERTLYKF